MTGEIPPWGHPVGENIAAPIIEQTRCFRVFRDVVAMRREHWESQGLAVELDLMFVPEMNGANYFYYFGLFKDGLGFACVVTSDGKTIINTSNVNSVALNQPQLRAMGSQRQYVAVPRKHIAIIKKLKNPADLRLRLDGLVHRLLGIAPEPVDDTDAVAAKGE